MTDTPGVDTPSLYGTPRTSMARSPKYSTAGAPATKEERLTRLADEQRIREKAAEEIVRLRTVMEEVNAKEDVDSSLEQIRSKPEEFLNSRHPAFRKVATAMKEEQEAAARVAGIEQEIRDHSMSSADMLVEVRSLIRKQNVEFEAMRAENVGLHERVSTLEAVVKALVSLPQIAQSAPDICAFAESRVDHEALHGVPTTLTLFQYATQHQLSPVVDYLLGIRAYGRKPYALVILNPPEESRKYEVPKKTCESSMLNQAAWWAPFKSAPNNQRGWLQVDAGRQVSLMGWKMEVQSAVSRPHDGSYVLSVSNDGETWVPVPIKTTWELFNRRVVPSLQNPGNLGRGEWKVTPQIMRLEQISHENQLHSAQECIAHARFFRLTPHSTIDQDARTIRFGLLILDDDGEHIVGPRLVRDLSPLHVAAKTGDTDLMAKLLDHGADLEMLAGIWKPAGDTDFSAGKTALELAAASASLAAVQMLVDRGAKVHEAQFEVPTGKAGDLVAGYLQTNGSKAVTRTTHEPGFDGMTTHH